MHFALLNLDDVLQPVDKEDIPDQLVERLQEEKRQEALRRKERNDAHLFGSISIYTEDCLMHHKGGDLINMERTPCFVFKVPKNGSYHDVVKIISEQMNYPPNGIRLWPFLQRNNHTFRPSRATIEPPEGRGSFLDNLNNWSIFLETIPPHLPIRPLANLDSSKLFAIIIILFSYLIYNYF